MLRIFIDASQRKNKIVTLEKIEGDDKKVLSKREGDIDIVSEIKNIVTEQGLELSKIDKFEFAQGGESFTGVKTGAAIANILQWAIKKTPINELPMPEYSGEPNITPAPSTK